MSREIKDFISGFGVGAGVGLGVSRQKMMQDAYAMKASGDPDSQELRDFDAANGTGLRRPSLAGRIGGALGLTGPAPGAAARRGAVALGTAPMVAAPAVAVDPNDTGVLYEDGGLVIPDLPPAVQYDENGQPVGWGSTGDKLPAVAPVMSTYNDPALETQRRNLGDDGPYPDVPEAVPTGKPVTSGGNPSTSGGGSGGRKRLNYQTRTAAFDPELDKDDPDNVVGPMLSGAMKFASNAFHLTNERAAVGDDPNREKGQRAFLSGVGAADPQDVQALNKIATAESGNQQLDKAALSMKRMEIIYRHYVQTGQTEKANKVAFELLQFGAGEAARMGQVALQQFKTGDHNGALNTMVQAYDDIPDGNSAKLSPDKKGVVIQDGKGRVVQTIPVTPENLFNYALGLSNRSGYWNVIANRAALTSPALQKDATLTNRSAVDAKRIELMDARIKKLGQGKAGGGPANLPPGLADVLQSIDGTSTVTPPGNAPAAVPPQGDNAEELDEDEIPQGDNPSAGGATPVIKSRTAENKPARSDTPEYDEPHPLEKWKGKNPYSEVLKSPKFSGYFGSKEGKGVRSVIEARSREMNKSVGEWEKGRREFIRQSKKDAATADKEDLAEVKEVGNQRDKAKPAGELYNTIKQEYDAVNDEYKDTGPSVFNTGKVKPSRIIDTAQSLATSNANMPANKALRLVRALTTPSAKEGEERLTSYNILGTDRIGNYVIVPTNNAQMRINVRPETLTELEHMRVELHRKLVEDSKKPGLFKQIGDAIKTPQRSEPTARPTRAGPRVIESEGGSLGDVGRAGAGGVRQMFNQEAVPLE